MTFAAALSPTAWRTELEALAARADQLRDCDDPEAHAALVTAAVGLLWCGWSPSLIAASCRASAWTGSPVVIAPPLATAVMEADDLNAAIARGGLVRPQRSFVLTAPPDRPDLVEPPLERPRAKVPVAPPPVPPDRPAEALLRDVAREVGAGDGRSLKRLMGQLGITAYRRSNRTLLTAADAERLREHVRANPDALCGRNVSLAPAAAGPDGIKVSDLADQLGMGRTTAAARAVADLAQRAGVEVIDGNGRRWLTAEGAARVRDLVTVG